MAVTASFIPGTGVLTEFGDAQDNTIVTSRDAAGTVLVNGGAVPVQGGQPTVANTSLIQAFGQAGNDTRRAASRQFVWRRRQRHPDRRIGR
jgi:hypothetical protein